MAEECQVVWLAHLIYEDKELTSLSTALRIIGTRSVLRVSPKTSQDMKSVKSSYLRMELDIKDSGKRM